ncbi:hypothetical protein KKF84_11180 [Myxococcota bacterium]|nr:hypothetical protein [Myxococcota bacterium]
MTGTSPGSPLHRRRGPLQPLTLALIVAWLVTCSAACDSGGSKLGARYTELSGSLTKTMNAIAGMEARSKLFARKIEAFDKKHRHLLKEKAALDKRLTAPGVSVTKILRQWEEAQKNLVNYFAARRALLLQQDLLLEQIENMYKKASGTYTRLQELDREMEK